MKKSVMKCFVDAGLFVVLSATGIIGLLLGLVIPHGRGGDAVFLGLHRHQWGDFHLFLSILLLVLIGFHLALNWGWVAQSAKRYFGALSGKFLMMLAGGWIAVLIVGWMILKF